MSQRFTECPDPLASDIDFNMKEYKSTSLMLTFSGVKVKRREDADAGAEEGEDDGEEGDEEEEDGVPMRLNDWI